jgi:hypothetical protein
MAQTLAKVISIMVLIFSLANSVWSDIAPAKEMRGITLATKEKAAEQIEMKSEEVYLELSKTTLKVKAVFHMNNTGPELKIKEGFPEGYYKDTLSDFTVTCQDKQIKTETIDFLEGAEKVHNKTQHDYWITWEHTYPANAQQDIEVNYTVNITWNGRVDELNLNQTGYILHTGAAWKGVIGKATVILAFKDGLTPLHVMHISKPKKAVIEKDKITWTFTNLEPTRKDNINFTFFINKDYPAILKEYKEFVKSWKSTMEVKSCAKIHDRKTYWELSKKLMSVGKKQENGELVISGGDDDPRWMLEQEVISVFCESLKYAKKEEGALETLPAATALFELMLNNKVFFDYTGIVYPSGLKGKKELIKLDPLNYPYREEYDYPHERSFVGFDDDKDELKLTEKEGTYVAKEMIDQDLVKAHKLIETGKKK